MTFDDGPDGNGTGENNTGAILNYLKENKLTATFFVCGNVWTNVFQDSVAQDDIHRIIDEGHSIGSHTFNHRSLDTISAATIVNEFSSNLDMAQSILGNTFQFSMYRAPFGYPFQTNNPNVTWVAPAVALNGVHVGWGIDTDDWKCAQNNKDGNCILNNLRAQLDAGHSGPILMHSVYKLTVKTLPQIVQMIRSYGYTFATVEQMIIEKYGASSAAIVKANKVAKFSDSQISAAAISECKNNQVVEVTY